MLLDRNQGVYVEDMLEVKRRFRDINNRTSMLPKISPGSAHGLKPVNQSKLQSMAINNMMYHD